jgi:gamma-glutamyltranspeptidase / glutathione hydrolase
VFRRWKCSGSERATCREAEAGHGAASRKAEPMRVFPRSSVITPSRRIPHPAFPGSACALRLALVVAAAGVLVAAGGAEAVRARQRLVLSASRAASQVGGEIMNEGGNATDAAVATAFALAVTHPTAGNIGGGGFLVYRAANGQSVAYDFRETAPPGSSPTMWLKDGRYDARQHHLSYLSVGVPGTVAGLHMAWKEHGRLPWKRLVGPAVKLARDGFVVSPGLARSLRGVLEEMKPYPASTAQFSRAGVPFEPGEWLKQPDLARTLERIERLGPAGFYEGETARLVDQEMRAHGGLVTREALKEYRAVRRDTVRGSYRGYDIVSVPPPSGGGVGLIEMLNILEGYDLAASGVGSPRTIHLIVEAMRRAFADRAWHIGDPEANRQMPVARLLSKDYAADLRRSIDEHKASKSSPSSFAWSHESDETTHVSVVDGSRDAVSLTYTLEYGYGSRIVVPGAGFLLNNQMGDFNAGPGLTNADGLIGTDPNLAAPGRRMLSSMAPTILSKDGRLFMVTGSPGGRTIINTVLLTVLNVVDFKMGAQDAVDAGRFHHQWLPDRTTFERTAMSPETAAVLRGMGHDLQEGGSQGVAEVIVDRGSGPEGGLEGGVDRRQADGLAVGR